MSFWSIMNWVAWGMSGVILFLIMSDFIKVEKERIAKKREGGR